MAIELKVPAVGESITEVEIGDWLKRKGDTVQKDEPVVTLESEKATVELPSPVAGTVTEVLKKKGDTARVGEVIAYLEHNGHAQKAAPAETKPVALPEPAQPVAPRVMPAAARALEQNELRVEEVKPTGPGGRLLKEDVQRHVGDSKSRAAESASAKPFAPVSSDGRQEEVVPMTRLRLTVAE